MKTARNWIPLALTVVVGAVLAFHCRQSHQMQMNDIVTRYTYECPFHLEDLWTVVMALAKERGRFPQDLTVVARKVPLVSERNIRLRLSPVLCPASQAPVGRGRPATNVFDYTYINWSSTFPHVADVPGDYPLAYDRTLSNHLGRGVYVVKVDGSVVWDEGAEYLREFSTRHPGFHIPPPKGLSQW